MEHLCIYLYKKKRVLVRSVSTDPLEGKQKVWVALMLLCLKAVKSTNLDGGKYGRHIICGAPAILKDV